MKFERLEIQNFSSYFGKHKIPLDTTTEQPVVIVIGSGGFGKTSMFRAINWSLYGEDYERVLLENKSIDILDYVNEAALKNAYIEKTEVVMSCALYFEHEGKRYYISQSVEVTPEKDNVKADKIVPKMLFRNTKLSEIKAEGDYVTVRHHKLLLDEMLPNNVRDYFLFDGDRISSLSSPGSSQEVRDAIFRVVDLELFQKAKEHLDDAAREYASNSKRESKGVLHEIEALYSNEWEMLERKKRELEENKNEIDSARRHIKILEGKLKNLPDTSKLQEKRDNLEIDIQRTVKSREDELATLRKSAYISAMEMIGDDCLKLVDDLNTKIKKGEVPKNIAKIFIEEMLNNGSCFFCMEKIEAGNKIFNALMARLEIDKNKKSNERLLDYRGDIKNVSDVINDGLIELKRANSQAHDFDSILFKLRLEKDQIDADLKILPQEDIVLIMRQLDEYRIDEIAQIRREADLQNQIGIITDKVKKLDVDRKELSKKQEKVRSYQLRESLARRAAEEINKIYELFAEESRAAVEKLTIEEFKNFIFSSSEYHVSLSKDYELEVLDSNGNEALQRLSNGQSQCLSLAFITAISRVSEKNPPLVIDMPFGRLDETVHAVISKRLPEITSQLILFLLPSTEWNEQTQRNLKSKAKYIYELEFDSVNRKTSIR